jgi:hypothetical protein
MRTAPPLHFSKLMSDDPGKKPLRDDHEGEPGWGGTGFGGSGYGSHQGFGEANYGVPPGAELDRYDPAPSDDALLEAVTSAIEAQIDGDLVQISIIDGEVTLTGVVDDPESRLNLEQVAYDVRGVLRVQNLIRVGRPEDPAEKQRWEEEETLS